MDLSDRAEAILDELLVLKCRRGDAEAWRMLVRRFEKRLLYFIRRFIDDERDALDVLQQTWLSAIKGISRLDEPRAVRTWLYRIARNQAVTRLRRRGIAIESTDPADLQRVPDSSDESEDPWPPEAAERLHAALSRLTVSHREVLTLHFLEDVSIEEIAAITGVPPGTVKSRLHYAKRALRCAIEKENWS